MSWPTETVTIVEDIESRIKANGAWHERHRDALIMLGAVSRQITAAYGEEAGYFAYNSGLQDLVARDPDNGK